jgi:hypothetical protein
MQLDRFVALLFGKTLVLRYCSRRASADKTAHEESNCLQASCSN